MKMLRFLIVLILSILSLQAYSQHSIKAASDTSTARVKKTFTKEDINKLISDNKVLILDFSATWCEPCKVMAPVMNEIEKEQAGKIKIIQVDYDINRNLSNSLNVYEIPFLQIYVDGKISQNIVGMIEKKVLLDMLPKQ
jgi:thioredoxin 1